MRDRRLEIVLWIAGVGCGISIVGLVVPWAWLETCMNVWGVDEVPTSPVFVYGVRVACSTYALIGVFFVMLARNPSAYRPFLSLGIAGLLFTGLICLVTGLALDMLPVWYLGDVVFCWVIGMLLLMWRPKQKVSA